MPGVNPRAMGGIEACWPCPRESRGSDLPLAVPLQRDTLRWHSESGMPLKVQQHSWILSRESQASLTLGLQGAPAPEEQGRTRPSPPHHRHHGSPGWHGGDSPARGVAQRGSSAPACQRHRGTGRRAAPAGPGRDSHVWEKPRSPSPGWGKRSSAGQAPGTAAPARPPRQSGRRPRSPGGDFDPAAGRACQHLLPAGCAAAAAAPPPSGTPTEEPLFAPAPRGRSVPPAGAPAAGAAPRPAALPELGTNFPRRAPPGAAACPQSCPAPRAAGAAADSNSPGPPLTPRARRREGPRYPTAQPGSSSHPVPRQRLPRRCAGGPTTFCAKSRRGPSFPFSSPFFPAPRGPALRRPLPRPRRPLCWPGQRRGCGRAAPTAAPSLSEGRGGAGPAPRGGEGKGREGRSGSRLRPRSSQDPARGGGEELSRSPPPLGPSRPHLCAPAAPSAPSCPQISAVAQRFGGEAPRGVPRTPKSGSVTKFEKHLGNLQTAGNNYPAIRLLWPSVCASSRGVTWQLSLGSDNSRVVFGWARKEQLWINKNVLMLGVCNHFWCINRHKC